MGFTQNRMANHLVAASSTGSVRICLFWYNQKCYAICKIYIYIYIYHRDPLQSLQNAKNTSIEKTRLPSCTLLALNLYFLLSISLFLSLTFFVGSYSVRLELCLKRNKIK